MFSGISGGERSGLFFYSHYLKLCERTLSFAVSLRAEGEVALLESPNGLGATAVSAYAEKRQELNFLRFLCRRCFCWLFRIRNIRIEVDRVLWQLKIRRHSSDGW